MISAESIISSSKQTGNFSSNFDHALMKNKDTMPALSHVGLLNASLWVEFEQIEINTERRIIDRQKKGIWRYVWAERGSL